MKSVFLPAALLMLSCTCYAQTPLFDSLHINQVHTVAQSNGDLFWHENGQFAKFRVPIDSSTNTIFAGSLWIGGLDASGGLHVAAQTYRQSGNDFFQGPVQDSQYYTMQSNAIWNRVWKINKTSVDSLILWQTNPSAYPGYVMPNDILLWPGNGDVSKGQAAQLAPFVDSNGDGIYDPQNGDYPCIKGDQCLYFIFNDDRAAHTETGGAKLGVEIHAMMYAYNAPGSSIDSTVFLNYKIYNRSNTTYSNVYCGQWTDFDIGDPFDDYIGSSVQHNLYYGYNGDTSDGANTYNPFIYGSHPPAQGVVFLQGPLADANDLVDNDRDGTVDEPGETSTIWQFVSYENNFSATGNPHTPMDHYNYLRAYWKDTTPVTHGGGGHGGTTPYSMMFPGASDPSGVCGNMVPLPDWSMASANYVPHDVRGVGSSGPFTLEAGSVECISYAYVFARGAGDQLSSIDAMLVASDTARAQFNLDNPCTCGSATTGIAQQQTTTLSIYPNPATSNINIVCGSNAAGSVVEIMDAAGQVVYSATVLSGNSTVVDVSTFTSGIYFVRVNKGSVVLTGKFIRN